MGTQYRCANERRRAAIRQPTAPDGTPLSPSLNGIDYLEVLADQKTLKVFFIHNLPGQPEPVPPEKPPLTPEQVVITGGVRVTNVRVVTVVASDNILTVNVDAPGDFSIYTLRLIKSPSDATPPEGFDPQLSQVEFSFKIDCPSDFDCQPRTACPPQRLPQPQIDYLSKDYASFRRLMLDRLAVTMPDWRERYSADVGLVLVELLAYAADHLSYYQDAVATEAYLGTARKRVSVRRHARLLDYIMHDGVNARVWMYLAVESGSSADGYTLPTGTPLLTRVDAPRGGLPPEALAVALAEGAEVFETLHDLTLRATHNEISFYTWSDEQCCLPKGSTRATLKNEDNRLQHLGAGDVLVFEERLSPTTGLVADADPSHRQVVRLSRVVHTEDPLDNTLVTEIEWHADDALLYPVCLSTLITDASGQGLVSDVSVARGNVVLADHGYTIHDEALIPEVVPAQGRYRPRLQHSGVTHHVLYDGERARRQAASGILHQDPRAALPVVNLLDHSVQWTVQRHLLYSDRFAAEFVVETEEDGGAYLRFGDDVLGRRPAGSSRLTATYRLGNGRAGNVGAGAIGHVVTDQSGIIDVRNPLPAQGGTDPEPIEQVRLYAPQAFRAQERAVTAADYAAAAQRHPDVQKAMATLRWTGSWHTVFVTVDRKGGRPVDAAFEAELLAFLERFRMAGHELEIDAPRFVPLDIAFTVCIAPSYLRAGVKVALLETFSDVDLRDGRRGFFHPDNLTFGQPVYLSQIVAAAMQVPGVLWVDTDDTPPKRNRFRRHGQSSRGELAAGRITFDRLEIARLDNDPNAAENGQLEFYLEGGL
jgi:hypothetical protein